MSSALNNLTCAEARSLIDAAIDGELDLIAHMAFDAHLASCAACAASHAARRALVDQVRTTAERFTTPAALRARLLTALPPDRPPVPAPPRRYRWWAGAAWASSAVAFAAGLALFLAVPGPQDSLTRDLVAAHVRSLMPEHLTDVPSSDRHTVKPWFSGRIALSPPVPNLADAGFPLVGGRLDYVDDHSAAVLIYRRNLHVINLFAWPAPTQPERSLRIDRRNGYHIVEWSSGGIAYAAVSDVDLAELQTFQRLWTVRAEHPDGGGTSTPQP